jgi:ribonuclease D
MQDLPNDDASAPSTGRSISKAEINALPLRWYDGPLDLVRTPDELERALGHLAGDQVLGFDTETRPSFRRGESHPPSLVQLAGEHRVVIIQLRALGLDWGGLLALFTDAGVHKAGIAPHDDLRKLRDLRPFQPAGFHDLSVRAREAGYRQTGLRALAALLFGERVSKSEQVSDWSARQLTRAQILYAATDAWMTRRLWLALAPPPPPTPGAG